MWASTCDVALSRGFFRERGGGGVRGLDVASPRVPEVGPVVALLGPVFGADVGGGDAVGLEQPGQAPPRPPRLALPQSPAPHLRPWTVVPVGQGLDDVGRDDPVRAPLGE